MAVKSILVTGGAGFIGSHLCRRLLSCGHRVICLDNFSTGREENILDLKSNHKFTLIRHDVTMPIYLKVDEIYNFACPASPVHYQRDPIKTTKTSVIGAINVLELARNTCARVLHASTSEVYGDPLIHPQIENYWGNVNPIGIRSCYDEGKRCAETLFFDYYRSYGVDIKVIRIFNTYGPYMDLNDGRVISNFIVQALMGKDLTIYGDGLQTRAFCYISDLIDGIMLMMNSGKGFTGPVNLGNPQEFTILELAEKIIELTGSDSKLQYKQLPADDPRKRRPDISLVKNSLGWFPKVTLDEGLKYTIEYFSQLKR